MKSAGLLGQDFKVLACQFCLILSYDPRKGEKEQLDC
jgi:hypothetical protein